MREFEKWMKIGLHNLITKNYIPMGFQPTYPLLWKNDSHDCIVFYYYQMMMIENSATLSSPKYRLVFDMTTEKPILFEELEQANEPLGSCSVFDSIEFELKQKSYIAKLNDAIETMERDGSVELDDIFEVWVQAHLTPLHKGLEQFVNSIA